MQGKGYGLAFIYLSIYDCTLALPLEMHQKLYLLYMYTQKMFMYITKKTCFFILSFFHPFIHRHLFSIRSKVRDQNPIDPFAGNESSNEDVPCSSFHLVLG